MILYRERVMGRQIVILGLVLGAALLLGSTASAQGYGRFATPRSFHPRSGYGNYRSYPHNYAEYNLRGTSRGLNGYGRGLNGYGRGLNGYGRGLNGYGGYGYRAPRYGVPGYGRPVPGQYPSQRNYGQAQFQFNFNR